MGVICGVTTNPSLIAKEGRDFNQAIKEITSIVDGPNKAWFAEKIKVTLHLIPSLAKTFVAFNPSRDYCCKCT